MKNASALPYLQDILESIAGIEETVANSTFEDYIESWQMRRAVERGVEIISEAVRKLEKHHDVEGRFPSIPWSEIKGIGNIIRHEYGQVDNNIMWKIAIRDLQPLKRVVEELLQNTEK